MDYGHVISHGLKMTILLSTGLMVGWFVYYLSTQVKMNEHQKGLLALVLFWTVGISLASALGFEMDLSWKNLMR